MDRIFRCSGYETVKTDMVRAEGCYLYDADGRKYLDVEAGVWCAVLGHNHPGVNEAIREQLGRTAHSGYRCTCGDVEETAAEQVLGSIGLPNGRCLFLSSGSEAVEFGVQAARLLSGKPLLITLSDSYLAAYGSAGRQMPDEWYRIDWNACAACPHTDRCDPACDLLEKIPFERVGGLVFEPGNAAGLVRLPPRQLVTALAERVRRHGGLVVVDEVTTGLGRTGEWYGCFHYGLRPDAAALGKGLGNGYPVSAVAMTGEMADRLEQSGFHYAQSHQNDPMACAVATAVVSAIRAEGLVEQSRRVGAVFLQGLRQVAGRRAAVREVRGRGLMIAMELCREGDRSLAVPVFRRLLEEGFLVGCKPAADILRFYPPLTIGEQEISRLLEHLDGALKPLS